MLAPTKSARGQSVDILGRRVVLGVLKKLTMIHPTVMTAGPPVLMPYANRLDTVNNHVHRQHCSIPIRCDTSRDTLHEILRQPCSFLCP